MDELQRRKIVDVMHALSVIASGRSHNPEISADACWKVLDEVLKIERRG